MEPDEGRYAQIPYEMLRTGDWVTPRQNEVLYFEKPVLHYWLTAIAFKIFGLNEFAARFWPALFGLLSIPITFFLGSRIYANRRAGEIAAVILGTSLLHLALSRINLTDMTLSFFLLLSLCGLWLGSSTRGWLLLFYAGMACALLSKGLVGVVLPCGIAFWYIVLTRQWRLIRQYLYIPGIFLFAVIAVPWFWLVCQRNPDFFHFFFIREHFLRYTTDMHDRYEPFWFFLPILLAALVPWTGWLPSVFRFIKTRWTPHKNSHVFLLSWCFVILFFYSLSSSKLIPYILPCLPPIALLMGGAIHTAIQNNDTAFLRKGLRESFGLNVVFALAFGVYPFFQDKIPIKSVAPIGLTLSIALFFSGLIALHTLKKNPFRAIQTQMLGAFFFCLFTLPLFGLVAYDRSAKDLAAFIEKRLYPGDLLAEYQSFDQALPFYLKRRLALVDYKGELEFGSQFPEAKDWFFTKESFYEFKKTRGVLLVMEKDAVPRFWDGKPPEGAIVEDFRNYTVMYFPMRQPHQP